MSPKDGGQAFPVNRGINSGSDGMTLRDYFAAKALPAMVAAFANDEGYAIPNFNNVAKHSYHLADAMLSERAKALGK